MTGTINKILITFPEDVELSNADMRRLDRFVNSLCEAWERQNPGKTMWPFGSGLLMKIHPAMLSDDEPIPFDESTYHVEVSARDAHPGELKQRQRYARFSNPNEMYEDLRDFHVKFGLKYNGPPRALPEDLSQFRTKFLAEELSEYLGMTKSEMDQFIDMAIGCHWANVPLEKKLDALVDLVYVALGTAYMHGFDFNEAWRRVHAANMAKVRSVKKGSGAERGGEFDVVKPPGWQAPDLSDLTRCAGCPTPELCGQEGHCDKVSNRYR